MILELDYSEVLVVFGKRYPRAEFQTASHVTPGTYADELVVRIYNSIFGYSRDLGSDYEKYYAVEYSKFAKFLYWKYQIDPETAIGIEKIRDSGAFVGYSRDTVGLLKDETVEGILDNILAELGEKQ